MCLACNVECVEAAVGDLSFTIAHTSETIDELFEKGRAEIPAVYIRTRVSKISEQERKVLERAKVIFLARLCERHHAFSIIDSVCTIEIGKEFRQTRLRALGAEQRVEVV